MATVTGVTYDKIQEMVGPSIVGLNIDPNSGVVTVNTQDGQTLNVGSVSVAKNTADALDAVYPVGSIYMSGLATSPATLFGFGTWTAISQGRVLVGVDTTQTEFSTAAKTGGEKTHTLTQAEIPTHTHSVAAHSHSSAAHSHTINHDHADATMSFQYEGNTTVTGSARRVTDIQNQTGGTGTSSDASINIPAYSGSSGSTTPGPTGSAGGGSTGTTGGDAAHNNLQPYLTCYIWKRTA